MGADGGGNAEPNAVSRPGGRSGWTPVLVRLPLRETLYKRTMVLLELHGESSASQNVQGGGTHSDDMTRPRTEADHAEGAPCSGEDRLQRVCAGSTDVDAISAPTRRYLALKSSAAAQSTGAAKGAHTGPDSTRGTAIRQAVPNAPGGNAERGWEEAGPQSRRRVTVPGVDPHLRQQRLDHRTIQLLFQPHRRIVMLPAEQRAYERELVAALEQARGESVHELRARARQVIERESAARRARVESGMPRGSMARGGGASPGGGAVAAGFVGASSRARRATKPRDGPGKGGRVGPTAARSRRSLPRGSRGASQASASPGRGARRLWNGRGVYVPVPLDASGPYRPGMMLDLRRFYAAGETGPEESEAKFGVVYDQHGNPLEYRPHRRARPHTGGAAYFAPREGRVSFEPAASAPGTARPDRQSTPLSVSVESIQERKTLRAADHAADLDAAVGVSAAPPTGTEAEALAASPPTRASRHSRATSRPSRCGRTLVAADVSSREESAGLVKVGSQPASSRGGPSHRPLPERGEAHTPKHTVPPLWQSTAASPGDAYPRTCAGVLATHALYCPRQGGSWSSSSSSSSTHTAVLTPPHPPPPLGSALAAVTATENEGPHRWSQATLERRLREAPFVPDAGVTALPPAVSSARVRQGLWGDSRPPASPPSPRSVKRVRFQRRPSPPRADGANATRAALPRGTIMAGRERSQVPRSYADRRGAASGASTARASTGGASLSGWGHHAGASASARTSPSLPAARAQAVVETGRRRGPASAAAITRTGEVRARRSAVFNSAMHGERAIAWRKGRAAAAPVLATPGLRGLSEPTRRAAAMAPTTGAVAGAEGGAGGSDSSRPGSRLATPAAGSHAGRAVGAGRAASARAERVVSRLRRDVYRSASQRGRPRGPATEAQRENTEPPPSPRVGKRSPVPHSPCYSRAGAGPSHPSAPQHSATDVQRPVTAGCAEGERHGETHVPGGGSGDEEGPVHALTAVTSAHGFLGDLDVGTLEAQTGYSRRELYRLFATFKSLCSLALHPQGIDEATFRHAVPVLALEDDFFAHRVFSHLDKNRDGHIEWPAFAEALSALDARDTRVQADFVFNVYDGDGDGRVKREDLVKFLQHSMMLDEVGGDELTQVCEGFVDEVFRELQVQEGRPYLVREDVKQYIDQDPEHRDIMQLLGRSSLGARALVAARQG